MRYALPMIALSLVVFAQSQPPSPTPAVKGGQPRQAATDRQRQTAADERGTEQSPNSVKVLPSAMTQGEASNGKAKELDQSSPDWWMVRLTAAIAVIGVIQTIVFGVQAYMLKQTIEKMDEIAGQQTKDVQASVAEATRAAAAMEGVSISMASNVESVRESVGINREIADRQKLITELQSRAYLTILFEALVPQNPSTGIRFQPRMRIENRGNTPAHDIRFSIVADVLPFPLRDDFTFPLPTDTAGHSSVIGPGLNKMISAVVPKLYPDTEATQISIGVGQRIATWGIVKYRDAFNIERSVRFGFTHYLLGETQWMSMDTTRHNESD
jgi:hypothetical protein